MTQGITAICSDDTAMAESFHMVTDLPRVLSRITSAVHTTDATIQSLRRNPVTAEIIHQPWRNAKGILATD